MTSFVLATVVKEFEKDLRSVGIIFKSIVSILNFKSIASILNFKSIASILRILVHLET